MTWTIEDEALFQRLNERRTREKRTLEECVERAVDQWAFHNMLSHEIAGYLIENATQIRKVLEPFDPEHEQYIGDLLR